MSDISCIPTGVRDLEPSANTWTNRHLQYLHRLGRVEVCAGRKSRPFYRRLCLAVEYLEHRVYPHPDGRPRRDWGSYGREARAELEE